MCTVATSSGQGMAVLFCNVVTFLFFAMNGKENALMKLHYGHKKGLTNCYSD